MGVPATVRLTLATDASALLLLPWPIVAECTTTAEASRIPIVWSFETASVTSDPSSAPPPSGSGPVSPRSIDTTPGTVACRTVARPLKVVVDAGNGMGGLTVPTVLGSLPLDVVPLYFELDGSFPNHEANPIDPENLRDLQAKVREVSADVGLAFDGDADRCFVVDERGDIVNPSVLTALIAVRELDRDPGRVAGYFDRAHLGGGEDAHVQLWPPMTTKSFPALRMGRDKCHAGGDWLLHRR